MTRALAYMGLVWAIAAWMLFAGAADAQQSEPIAYDAWEGVATQIEGRLEDGQISVEGLDAIRGSVVVWRDRFLEGTEVNAEQIESITQQIDALPPPPAEGETESDEIVAQREDLNAALAEARAPRIRADTALARANTLISRIDTRIREAQADRLLELQPTPLNPSLWGATLSRLGETTSDISDEVRGNVANLQSRGEFSSRLPVSLLLLIVAFYLIIRGPRLVERLVIRVEKRASELGQVVFGFIVSLGTILLPLIGISLINAALISTGLLGPVGRATAVGINVGIVVYATSRWLGRRIFPERDGAPTPVSLDAGARSRGRGLSRLAGGLLALLLIMQVVDEIEQFDGILLSVVAFPIFVALGVTLFLIGRLIRAGRSQVADATGYADYLVGISGRVLQILGILGPIAAAIGYFNLAESILVPATQTLAVVAFLVTLHYVVRAAYGLIRGLTPDQSDDALVPVLISFLFTIATLPVVALFWGARQTDLLEVWTRFRAGVRFGESTISPGDFLTVILVFVLGLMLTRLLQGVLRTSVLPRTTLDKGGRNAVVSGLGYVGITLAALAGITAAGIDLSSLAIIVGALGVGIGFGLQNIVNNFVSGIILLIERPIGEGDWVDVNGNFGVVKSISVRSTVIETFDRTDVIVPNGDLVSGTVTNWTRGNSIGRVIVPVGVAYGTDTRKVEAILTEIAEAHPIVSVDPGPRVLFRGFGADSLDFEIRAILSDVSHFMTVQSDLNHEIARRFTEEGIEIPFAQRDIWLRNPEALTGGIQAPEGEAGGLPDENERPAEPRPPSEPLDPRLTQGD